MMVCCAIESMGYHTVHPDATQEACCGESRSPILRCRIKSMAIPRWYCDRQHPKSHD